MDNFTQDKSMEECDLRETLELCAKNMKPVAKRNNVQLDLKFDDTPVMFYYNENQIFRAVLNLISNAIRYATSKMIVGCKKSDGTVQISVEDVRQGISPEALPYIFVL